MTTFPDLARTLPMHRTEVANVLMRFNESIRVRLWGRELHSFRAGEVYNVSIAVAAVLLAQGCAEPVAEPPAVPLVRVA